MEDTVHETNAGALVGILVGQLDVDLPKTALERCCIKSAHIKGSCGGPHTVFRPLEPDVELLPALCQRCRDGPRTECRGHRHYSVVSSGQMNILVGERRTVIID